MATSTRIPIAIEDELRNSYLEYAMSVIIGRAIPRVEDGLKPVHRRILYAMHEMRLNWNQPYRKSARVVGEVLGKYHPHGDQAVYDALVRMAQTFSMRYPLIDGQGNFGSVDGDQPAAMRYTESRLSRLASELLADIDKETVDFGPNFDDSEHEPLVLPSKVPNLLINGSAGIAVGMATNVAPHNLREVIDATVRVLNDPSITIDQLMVDDEPSGRIGIRGPDFPTGAFIYGTAGIRQALHTGRGRIVMRARTAVEPMPGKSADRQQIVVTELPYMVNKAELIKKIAQLVRDKEIEGISDLRDESDREGMRIVIELKRDAADQLVLNQLFQQTALQSTFGVNQLAIVAGRPKVLDVKETLQHFIDHRRDVVTRRTRFELREAEAQRELVEGLGMAVTEVDLVVKTIRESKDPETARAALQLLPLHGLEEFVKRAGRPESEIEAAKARGEYHLSERQAKAILEMRLSRLTGLEREKLAAEYGELCDLIAKLKFILESETELKRVIVSELDEIKERYGDARRTEIIPVEGEITIADLVAHEDVVVTVSHAGYIKRTPVSEYRAQGRGGRGRRTMETRDEDFVEQIFIANNHDHVLYLSDRGIAYLKKVFEIPEASRASRGRALVNFVGLEPGARVAAIVPIKEFREGDDLITCTKGGTVKRTQLSAYENIRVTGIIGVGLEPEDQLLAAGVCNEESHVIIGTARGMSIRFAASEARRMGRDARGVRGIQLREGDSAVSMDVIQSEQQQVLAVSEKGYGKRTEVSEFRQQGRGGIGIIAMDASARNGAVVKLVLVTPEDELIAVTDAGQLIRTKVSEVRLAGRNTQGVRVIRLDENERVVDVGLLAERDEEGQSGGSPPSEDGTPEDETPDDDGSSGNGAPPNGAQ